MYSGPKYTEGIDLAKPLPETALDIFTTALEECNVPAAFDRHLRFEDHKLILHPSPLLKPDIVELDLF
jgi:hypothetical protein